MKIQYFCFSEDSIVVFQWKSSAWSCFLILLKMRTNSPWRKARPYKLSGKIGIQAGVFLYYLMWWHNAWYYALLCQFQFVFSREVEDKGWWKGEVDGRWVAQIINKLENKKINLPHRYILNTLDFVYWLMGPVHVLHVQNIRFPYGTFWNMERFTCGLLQKLYLHYFRTGVFPDNFVKLIVEEDKRERKPSRYNQ